MRPSVALALLGLALPVEGQAAPILDSIAHQASCSASQPGSTGQSFFQTGAASTFNVQGVTCTSGPTDPGPGGPIPDTAQTQQVSNVTPLFMDSQGIAGANKGNNSLATASSNASITIDFTTDDDFAYVLSGGGSGLPNDFQNQIGFEIRLWEPSSSTDLYLLTEDGTAGSTSGLLLAGHTYKLSGFARATSLQTVPLAQASYGFQLSLAAVPEPAVAWLLLPTALWFVRRRLARSR